MNDSRLSQLSGRPPFSREEAAELVRAQWGVLGDLEPLHSERDQNWRVIAAGGPELVAKISNSNDDDAIIDLQLQMMRELSAAGIPCPAPVQARSGQWTEFVDGHLVWLIDYLPGTVMAAVPRSVEVCTNLGEIVGACAVILADFDHPAAHREMQWDLIHAGRVFDAFAHQVTDPARREILDRVRRVFSTRVQPAMAGLVKGIVHNDVNDYNVLVAGNRVSALLDFGDAVYTAVVNDLAIACAYAMMDCPDPLAMRDALVAGYERHRPLLPAERALLPDLICTRLAVSVTISAHQQTREPDNEYLTISEKPAWDLLTKLEEQHQ